MVHGTVDGSVIRADDGFVVRTDDGSVVRTDDGSIVCTGDGSIVRSGDVPSRHTVPGPSSTHALLYDKYPSAGRVR